MDNWTNAHLESEKSGYSSKPRNIGGIMNVLMTIIHGVDPRTN